MSEAPDELEQLDLQSHNLRDEKRAQLFKLFPEVRTEDGKVDFDRLKQILGGGLDVGKERYGLVWPGKAECFQTIQKPTLATLLPCEVESVNFYSTGNLIIEGDNLEVLKLLQKSYIGKVRMIYIDPPYNTGNDFIYPDNYTESLQTYLDYTGQTDGNGKKFSTNSDTNGRFHSKWMNMMYPRLYLARNLLKEDGCIFITIDDTEVANLRLIANEIFGEENFVANIVWEKKYAKQNDATWLSTSHDHILLYAKNKSVFRPNKIERGPDQLKGYVNHDKDPRGLWQSVVYTCNKTRHGRPNLFYPIIHPKTGKEVWPSETRVWGYDQAKHRQHVEDKRLWWGANGEQEKPRLKVFLSEVGTGVVPDTLWLRSEVGDNQDAKRTLLELLPASSFETPKPPSLVSRMLELVTEAHRNDIILDFFAGSGTTGQAVMETNGRDSGNRKFILVQLPEPTGETDLATIAEVTKERMRRFINKQNDSEALALPFQEGQDRGFRVYKLAESNFTTWKADIPHTTDKLVEQLELHIDHIREGRTSNDILFEILLKSGFPLTTEVEILRLSEKSVYSVAGGALLICLERDLTLELVRAIADKRPERVVCLDQGFDNNDQLKANAVYTFKSKGIASFKTV